ncbi:MAG: signal peptidase I [Dysgonamonadaceae bacterium]|jgi:signal peptidase I|nr:signal peptidase I [Dysgonamonadaceae bacterium]
MKSKINYSWRQFWKELLTWTVVIIIAIMLATAMRVFLFCSFKVPSASMLPTIEPGDFIMVNKQIPGPRVYPHFPYLLGEDGKIATKRFKGIRKIKRNDVIVFNFPYNDWNKLEMDINLNYVKRCVAIPGDTFLIDNGIYKIENAQGEIIGCRENQERFRADITNGKSLVFPYDTINYRWTRKDFGPLYIPKKGDKISIDTCNYSLYKKIIRYETNNPNFKRHDGAVWLGDSIIREYTFQMNYYFMAGDYVFDSVDSRYWGLVPEDHIIGKAVMIWKSEDMNTQKFKWKRFFKLL